MKRIILVVAFTFFATIIHAQSMSMIWTAGMYESSGTIPSFGEKIVLDASGNSYTTGSFQGTMDFDPGVGVYNLVAPSWGSSVFILKLDANGNFVWAKCFGGLSGANALCYSIALDADGNVFIAGDFTGTVDFDPGAGVANSTVAGIGTIKDIFMVKLDASGNYLWSRTFGGIDEENALAITVDRTGNLYITGIFRATVDFDHGPGSYVVSVTGGGLGIFVSKTDHLGNFVWAKTIVGITGPEGGQGHAIVTDSDNNVYYTGHFTGTLDFNPGPGTYNMTAPTGTSAFVFISELDSLGNFVWAKKYGGTGLTYATAITIDTANNLYTTGWFNGTTDFDPDAGILSISAAPNDDVFISKLGPFGNLKWAKKIGGSKQEQGRGIEVDSLGNVYTAGSFSGNVDFDPGTSTFFMISGSSGVDSDIFISKLDSLGSFEMAVHMGGNASVYANAIQVDESGNVFITGAYVGTTDFEPGPGVYNLSTPTTNGVFVEKLHQSLVGIHEMQIPNQISIYPNPTNSSFSVFISSPIYEGYLEMYNSIGELILSQKIINQQNTIDLKKHAGGLYFVKVISDGEVIGMKKVVKE